MKDRMNLAVKEKTNSNLNIRLRLAARNGLTKTVKSLLNKKHLDFNTALRLAIQNKHTKVAQLLLEHKDVNPTTQNNHLFFIAAKNYNANIMRLLLSDPRINTTIENTHSFCLAITRSYTNIEKIHILIKEDISITTKRYQNELSSLTSLSSALKLFPTLMEKFETVNKPELMSANEWKISSYIWSSLRSNAIKKIDQLLENYHKECSKSHMDIFNRIEYLKKIQETIIELTTSKLEINRMKALKQLEVQTTLNLAYYQCKKLKLTAR